MNSSVEDAKHFLSLFDSSKDIGAFRQGMELLISIIDSNTDDDKTIANNIFASYLAKGFDFTTEKMKPYMHELDQTKDFYIKNETPLPTAMLFRFLEIADDEARIIVSEFMAFLIDNKEHIDLEKGKYRS